MRIVGHRGWRGKFPQNTLIGFQQLALLGIDSVELDIVVNKDGQLIVSHEPWFDLEYCISPKENNFFQLSTIEIQKIDCGSKEDVRYPEMKNFAQCKPLFKSVIELWESMDYKPFIALEVKSEIKLYGSYQPFPLDFCKILMDFEKKYLSNYQYFVQSFDPLFLKTYHKTNPNQSTGLLIEHETNLIKELDFLGYKPDYYNPEHILLSEKLCQSIKDLGMKTYTWTVNNTTDYDRIKNLPLEGIITDYPERFI